MSDPNPYQPAAVSIDGSEGAPPATGDVPEALVAALSRGKAWVFGLAALGLALAGIMVLAAVALTAAGAFMADRASLPFPMWLLGLGYLVFAAMFGVPAGLLFRYGLASGKVRAQGGMPELERAVRSLTHVWVGVGGAIITSFLVWLALYVVIMMSMGPELMEGMDAAQ